MDSTTSQTKTSKNMKPRFGQQGNGGHHDSDAIRSDIARTREKMDHTLEEIGERMQPRHLLDEVLDFFRSHKPDPEKVKERAGAAASKAGDIASTVSHAVTDVIRHHPLPTLLIGAGIAWAIVERQRESRRGYDTDADFAMGGYEGGQTGEPYTGEAYTGETAGGASGAMEGLKEKAVEAKEKISGRMEMAKEKGRHLRERAAETGRMAREKAGQWKEGAQRKFVETSEAHPLTTGLGFLAVGILAGLALPSSRKENELMGEMSDRLKGQAKAKGQELVERGKNVATAAVTAAKEKAAEEGLTPESLKQKAQSVASEAKGAAQGAAEREGFKTPERPMTGSATAGSAGSPCCESSSPQQG